jgi:uncharacterized cupredoxin-like copper-binding protein
MAAYYVLGITLVLFALGLTAVGITREGFPPTRGAGRRLMALAAAIVVATLAVLVATTGREHPREEAKAEAAKKQAEAGKPAPPAAEPGGGAVQVVEKEYALSLPGGTTLKAGKSTFQAANQGKIQHDLALEGGGAKEVKTPLIDPGKDAKLEVDLKPGKYKLYCTVPGHEQLGMKTVVTVE